MVKSIVLSKVLQNTLLTGGTYILYSLIGGNGIVKDHRLWSHVDLDLNSVSATYQQCELGQINVYDLIFLSAVSEK